MSVVRNVAVAAAAGAALAAGQVLVAELVGITTLDADFAAGNERVQGVQVTLVAWYSAVAVALAVAVAWAVRPAGRATPTDASGRGGTTDRAVVAGAPTEEVGELAVVLAAAVGALTGYPVVAQLAGGVIGGEATAAVLRGVVLGLVAAIAVLRLPAVGRGLAAYTALQWLAALVLTLTVPRTVNYAGMVEPLGMDLTYLRDAGYHASAMLPMAVAVLVLSAVLGTRSVIAAAAGPVLATAAYLVDREQLYLWNADAFRIVAVIAVGALLVAAAAKAIRRRAAH